MKFDKWRDHDVLKQKILEGLPLDPKYGMPVMKRVAKADVRNPIPFNCLGSTKNRKERWFHFFIDDYQFERIWNNFVTYVPMLMDCEGGFSPDFSLYLGMPTVLQQWNSFRNKAIGARLQRMGKTIIPNVGFSDEKSLDFAFAGIPENSILSITTQGCLQNGVCKQSLLNGLHELCRQKYPTKLYVVGLFPEKWKDKFPMPIETVPTFAGTRWGGNHG